MQVFPVGSRFVLIRLAERKLPAPGELELATERAREQLGEAARRRVFERWTSASVRELEGSGKIVRYPLYASPN